MVCKNLLRSTGNARLAQRSRGWPVQSNDGSGGGRRGEPTRVRIRLIRFKDGEGKHCPTRGEVEEESFPASRWAGLRRREASSKFCAGQADDFLARDWIEGECDPAPRSSAAPVTYWRGGRGARRAALALVTPRAPGRAGGPHPGPRQAAAPGCEAVGAGGCMY